jgi:hypothetical protein
MEAAQERRADRSDDRVVLAAHNHDEQHTPVAEEIDQVLIVSKHEDDLPMRDLDDRLLFIREREPGGDLDALTPASANADGGEFKAMQPPKMMLLTPMTHIDAISMFDKHICYESDVKGYDVALPHTFVEYYMGWKDSRLPKCGAIVTNPLVMPDGTLLAPKGLDRESKVFFRIDPALLEILPKREECTDAAIAEAMTFLFDEFLGDVATGFEGKCTCIAAVMTILERELLPGRFAFIVSAPIRGGGKTMATQLMIVAATGKEASAKPWSMDGEERKKSLFATCREGLPALVWDNLKRGTQIDCPHIQAALTAPTINDRILGESRNGTASAKTIQFFTGNNIMARGEMMSRALTIDIEVNRPDPENRPFRRRFPIEWTLVNRAKILRAVYTIMLGNPRLGAHAGNESATRFPMWWRLVGSAVEHAAEVLRRTGLERWTDAHVDFGAKVLANELENDDDTSNLTLLLDFLAREFGVGVGAYERDGKRFAPAECTFTSGKLWGLIEDPETNARSEARCALIELAKVPREALKDLNSKWTGARLKKICGMVAISEVDGLQRSMRLQCAQNRTRQNAYWVEVVR